MKFFSSRIVFFVLSSSLTFAIPPKLLASKVRDDREVHVASVHGDVRVSRGKDHRPDLNQAWEQALVGELIQEGCALATGEGRAEIEFENGSTVYLAENSMLLFRELSAPGDRIVSRMSLVTGTATFSLQPAINESFFMDTPTDHLKLSPPETFFGRIDAYLDATAITPQDPKGGRVARSGAPPFQIQQGKTVFIQGGEILETANRNNNDVAAILVGYVAWGSLLPGLPDSDTPPEAGPLPERSQASHGLASSHTQELTDWDAWVSARVQQRRTATGAALKASGLSSPIPGLADLYEHGTFFSCEPYGICWEAAEPDDAQDFAPQAASPNPQSPAQGQVNPPFQPQTVQWEELLQGWCSPPTLRTVTRVAHTPGELQKLERMKATAQKARNSRAAYPINCENGYWIPYHRHYARVVTPQVPRHCVGARCKPIHAPRPVWVRVGKQIGFVPAHPKDEKGKPPINSKEGILVPPSKPGERTERLALEPLQKVIVFDKAPREFRGEPFNQVLRVPPPEIHAHLVQEATRQNSLSPSAHAALPITYDYKTHHFLMPASVDAGTKPGSKGVAVGGIDSHGKVGSFADGHSGVYAQSFARSEAAASYRGGSNSTGGYGGGYSGGGHGSGYSWGSYSSGSHSSGSGSSGASSSHSSSGGGWSPSSSGSSGSSSSSSPTSSGGSSHGRP